MARTRNATIDAFRGVAILMVLAFHYLYCWTPPNMPQDTYGFDYIYPSWLSYGRQGVELFFVISGLVITMTVLRASSPLNFAIRRFGRLYPALIAASLVTLLLCAAAPVEIRPSAHDLAPTFLMAPEKFGARFIDPSYWTLAVEIKFYAAVAVSAALFRQRFWLLVPLFGLALDAVHVITGSHWPYFLLGMAAWFALFERRATPAVYLAGSAVALFIAFPGGPFGAAPAPLALAAVMCALIAVNWAPPILPWIGRISYSLYLVHQTMGVYLIHTLKAAGLPDLVAVVSTAGAMLALAWLMFTYVENPGQRATMKAYSWAASYEPVRRLAFWRTRSEAAT